MYPMRLIVCLAGGAIAAGICVGGMWLGGQVAMTMPVVLSTAANRLLIGFVIAASGWRLHYLVHGAAVGLIVTLSVSVMILPDFRGFLMFTGAGAAYGLLIELAATRLFGAEME